MVNKNKVMYNLHHIKSRIIGNLMLSAAVCIVFLFACGKDGSNTSSFKGTWKGSYTGDNDHGLWQVVISSNGGANGIAVSAISSDTLAIVGFVNNFGQLSAAFGPASLGGEFNGLMSIGTASGTWELGEDDNGTWTGTKQ